MYPGQSVVVNPTAAGGSHVLLYPDGMHTRVVPILRQPAPDDGRIIHLHMPVKHRVVHHRPKPVVEATTVDVPGYNAPPPDEVASLPPPKPKVVATPKPAAPKRAPAQAPVQTASTGAGVPFSFDPATSPYVPPAPAPQTNKRVASNTPAPAATTPGPASDGTLSRRSQIIFAAKASDPAPNALDAIRMLGNDLNNALTSGASRIQLQAYGGAKSDKSSDARRLSLKRALAIRQILIDAGVPSSKIDVRAMGGADDGPLDRVDVLVRG